MAWYSIAGAPGGTFDPALPTGTYRSRWEAVEALAGWRERAGRRGLWRDDVAVCGPFRTRREAREASFPPGPCWDGGGHSLAAFLAGEANAWEDERWPDRNWWDDVFAGHPWVDMDATPDDAESVVMVDGTSVRWGPSWDGRQRWLVA